MKAKQFKPNQQAENQFAKALRKVAQQAGHVVEMHVDGHTLKNSDEMVKVLTDYARRLGPWAEAQAAKMVNRVASKNKKAWEKNSREMGKLLRGNGEIYLNAAALIQEQTKLIKSIPLKAAERAQQLALEAFFNGTRADEIAKELARSGKVSESDAERIARSETARANSVITQSRAQAIGSTQYIWRNSGDAAVRDAHRIYKGKKLDGMVFSWDRPPTLDDGTTGHPGTSPNCRCYPEPFFPK